MDESRPSFWRTRLGAVCLLAAVAASAYLYVFHAAHLYAVLPYLVLLLCPLMHFFMHRGHHGNRHHGQVRQGPEHRDAQD